MEKPAQQKWKSKLNNFFYYLLSPWRFFKLFCFSLGFMVLLLGTGMAVYVANFFHSLPPVEHMQFSELQVMAQKYVMKHLEDKKKQYHWVSIKNINRDLVYAIVTGEDATFFEHDGINYEAIVSALAENLKRHEYAYGASTISQQVTKLLFLDSGKSLKRKLQEFFITKKLEARFKKNEILEVYLNVAEFGPDIYGVNSAAHLLFRKQTQKINAAEGAFLALLLPSPRRNYYSMYQNKFFPVAEKKKLKRILRDLYYNEFISAHQYHAYLRYNYFSSPRLPASK